MVAQTRRKLALQLGTVASSGRYFFLKMTYVLIGGQCIGVIFLLRGGTPAKCCHGIFFLGAPAAILDFLHRVSAGSGTAVHSYVSLAAAAAPLHPRVGRSSDDEKMTLALTSAPNDGCCAWTPGGSWEGSAQWNRPAGPLAESR